jgi:hypothetical protein
VFARFTNGLPAGWSGSAASNLGAARGGVFGTSTRRWDYELVSPKVSLKRGSYAVVLQGRVVAGGLDLGVLDAGHNRWIEQRFYWYGQRADFGRGLMKTPFRISQPTTIQLILSNWRPADGSSRWQLSEMRLVRVS